MSDRGGRRLLGLTLVLFLTPALPAQVHRAPEPGASHRLLEGSNLPASPEEAMAQRLGQLRDAQRIQDLIRKLRDDPSLREKLTKGMTLQELQKLQEELKGGPGLGGNSQLGDKLLGRLKDSGVVNKEDLEAIERLKQRRREAQGSDPGQAPGANPPGGRDGEGRGPQQRPGSTAPGGPQPPAGGAPAQKPPPPSLWDRMRDKVAGWSGSRPDEFPDRMADWLDKLGDGTTGDAIREGLRNMGRGDNSWPLKLDERAVEWLGKVSELTPNLAAEEGGRWPDLGSFFREFKDKMPEMKEPGSPVGGAGDAGLSLLPALACLAAVALVGYLLWRRAGRRQDGSGPAWRVGPWPVTPGAVATRGDLVRAFEHLALLCLGPAARTCNHRELADRLGSEADPRSRLAARELAGLYERARYTPDDEPLADDDLAAARHDLSLLAGAAAS
jgi:hypothetical protein